MSEKEAEFIKELKAWVKKLQRLVVALLISLAAVIASWALISARSDATTTTEICNLKKVQAAQELLLQNKADIASVKAIKTDLKQEITTNQDAILGQLEILKTLVLQMTAPTTYNYKVKTTNK